MNKRSRKHLRETRRGAVLIEATMASCALLLTAGGLLFIHSYALKLIDAAQQARASAWSRALHECNQDEPLMQDLAQDLIKGEIPVPDGWIPKPLDVEVSMSVQGLLGHQTRTVSQTMTFICNPKPSHADPLAKPNEWVIGLFK